MWILYRVASLLVNVFSLILLAYVILSFVRPRPNPFVDTLFRVVDTILNPIRRLLNRLLPPQARFLDWSPLVALLLARIVLMVLRMFLWSRLW